MFEKCLSFSEEFGMAAWAQREIKGSFGVSHRPVVFLTVGLYQDSAID